MKKTFLTVILAIALSLTAFAGMQYTVVKANYPIAINGLPMTFNDVSPMNYNGTTMLPLRAVAEALGVPIEWDDSAKQINIETIDTEDIKASCVMVQVGKGNQYTGQGSAVLIDYGKALTAYHVVKGADYFEINYNDSDAHNVCKLSDIDESEDAAILMLSDKTAKPAKVGDSDKIKTGDRVYVVSSPSKNKNLVSGGKITYIYSTTNLPGIPIKFEIDAYADSGSSGGGVFNDRGELIGIVQGKKLDSKISVLPINDIRKALANN